MLCSSTFYTLFVLDREIIMSFNDIPEDQEESFPCDCEGIIILDKKTMICDKCNSKKYMTGKKKGGIY